MNYRQVVTPSWLCEKIVKIECDLVEKMPKFLDLWHRAQAISRNEFTQLARSNTHCFTPHSAWHMNPLVWLSVTDDQKRKGQMRNQQGICCGWQFCSWVYQALTITSWKGWLIKAWLRQASEVFAALFRNKSPPHKDDLLAYFHRLTVAGHCSQIKSCGSRCLERISMEPVRHVCWHCRACRCRGRPAAGSPLDQQEHKSF